jgi:hypothetical protein
VDRRRSRGPRALLGIVVGISMLAAGCSTHSAAVSHPCSTVSKQGKVVAVSNRGRVGLAKIGLTPKGLKAQQKCSS